MTGNKFLFLKQKNGTSLLEIVVAMGMFVFLMLLSTKIFQSLLNSQSRAYNIQDTQETTRYMMEMMSKEIRTAQVSKNDCAPNTSYETSNLIYNEDDNEPGIAKILYFKNQDDACVQYYLKNNRLYKKSNGLELPISNHRLKITDFNFNIADTDILSGLKTTQAKITISFNTEINTPKETEKIKNTIQTTISSRTY